jgi:hypothetical protein
MVLISVLVVVSRPSSQDLGVEIKTKTKTLAKGLEIKSKTFDTGLETKTKPFTLNSSALEDQDLGLEITRLATT